MCAAGDAALAVLVHAETTEVLMCLRMNLRCAPSFGLATGGRGSCHTTQQEPVASCRWDRQGMAERRFQSDRDLRWVFLRMVLREQ